MRRVNIRQQRKEFGKQGGLAKARRLQELKLKQKATQSQSHIKPKNLLGGGSSNGSKNPPPKFDQNDFDERDWRLLAAAKKKISDRLKASVGSGPPVTDAEYLEAIADESGVTPKRVIQLHEKMGVRL